MLNRLTKFKDPENGHKAGAYQPAMMDSIKDSCRLLREHVSRFRLPFSVSFGVFCVDETTSPDERLALANEVSCKIERRGGDVARMAA